jgi:hypothetical protein
MPVAVLSHTLIGFGLAVSVPVAVVAAVPELAGVAEVPELAGVLVFVCGLLVTGASGVPEQPDIAKVPAMRRKIASTGITLFI